MAASGEGEENHWPGYVDALTTMTMMLIFIMTILAVTIFGLSQNISRTLVERIARAAHIDVDAFSAAGTQEFAEHVASAIESNPPLGGQTALAMAPSGPAPHETRTVASSAPPAVDGASKVSVDQSSALLTLSFLARATRLDDAAAGEMKDFLSKGGYLDGRAAIELKAFATKEGAVSDARRVAFYRLMTVRQRLVALGVPVKLIRTQIEDGRPESGETLQLFARQAG